MRNPQPDAGEVAAWAAALRQHGLLGPHERLLGLLRQDSAGPDLRGVALTDSRLFNFAAADTIRQLAWEDAADAECKVRLRRTARYEFRLRDGTALSVLLSGDPDGLDAFCRLLDETCSARFPGFAPKQPPPEEPVSPRPAPPEPRSRAAPSFPPSREDQGRAPNPRERFLTSNEPDPLSVAALLLACAGLIPGYGVLFVPAALGTLFYARARGLSLGSEWSRPLSRMTLLLAALGLISFLLYRLALQFPSSLAFGRAAYHADPPAYLSEHWIAAAVAAVFLLLFSVSFHEAAHALVALWNGDSTADKMGRITLNPLAHLDPFGSILLPFLLAWSTAGGFYFAYARPVPVNPNRYRNLRVGYVTVSFAGPGTNFLLALVGIWLQFLIACSAVVIHGLTETAVVFHPVVASALYFVRLFIFLNVLLGCFNLLPIPPLDGYRVLQGILPWRWTDPLRPLERYGFFILVILLMSGTLGGLFVVVESLSAVAPLFADLLRP